MKNVQRYVVFWMRNILESKNLHEIAKGYLKNGQCFNCPMIDDCAEYAREMFMTKRHIVPFEKTTMATKFIKFLLSEAPDLKVILLFDNKKNQLFVYRSHFETTEFRKVVLPAILEEYDLLFADVPFSQQYELHDLEEVMLIRNIDPEYVKVVN